MPPTDAISTRHRNARKPRDSAILLADARCVYCGTALAVGEPLRLLRKATLDHVVPRAHGGTRHEANLVPACSHCNQAKRDRTLEEWIADLIEARRRIRLGELAHLNPSSPTPAP